ncbi:MAG: CRISPR-associated endoribonuclease Cas6 [Liquorilactobacillus hordei]|jgi:CRISPR-associated endoribonuclease Cas6|uniref:CRISPR-associated endoribonuclease Cas6 n=1 Tax=Liquorilactobacillus hordei TaxID=468911 RepID=UPI0039EB39C7
MRFSIELKFVSPKAKPVKLKIRYQEAFLYLLKSGLSHVDPNLFSYLYRKNTPKLFCLAANFPDATFYADSITLGEKNNAYWQLSTADAKLGLSFYNTLMYLYKNGPWPFGKCLKVIFGSPFQIKEPVIVTNEIKVKTLSPLVVRKDKRLFLSGTKDANLEQFNQVLQGNMQSRFKNYYPKEISHMIENMTYLPIKTRKTVIKTFDINIESTVGVFSLTADPVLLSLLVKNGLGIRTGSFSGCLKVIH